MTEKPWDAIEEDFRAHGFLAECADGFRANFRNAMTTWFDIAHRINALAQRLYLGSADELPGKMVMDPVALGILMMPRCLSGFQGAIILGERGMGIEAQALVRGVFETAFWMGYLRLDPENAMPRLRRETFQGQSKLYEAALKHLNGVDPKVRDQIKAELAKTNEVYCNLPRPLEVEKLAKAGGYENSYYFYKDLSGAAAHLSLKSIHLYLQHDAEGEIAGHQFGPDDESVGKAIWLGCEAILLAMNALDLLLGGTACRQEMDALRDELEELEPYGQSFGC